MIKFIELACSFIVTSAINISCYKGENSPDLLATHSCLAVKLRGAHESTTTPNFPRPSVNIVWSSLSWSNCCWWCSTRRSSTWAICCWCCSSLSICSCSWDCWSSGNSSSSVVLWLATQPAARTNSTIFIMVAIWNATTSAGLDHSTFDDIHSLVNTVDIVKVVAVPWLAATCTGLDYQWWMGDRNTNIPWPTSNLGQPVAHEFVDTNVAWSISISDVQSRGKVSHTRHGSDLPLLNSAYLIRLKKSAKPRYFVKSAAVDSGQWTPRTEIPRSKCEQTDLNTAGRR